jgi:hypothetical protein
MKAELRVLGLLLAVSAVAVAEMRTWTFEKSGKTIQGEVVGFSGDAVNLRLADGKTYSVPVAYLTASNRMDLAAERANQWKEVEVVRLQGATSAGRYKRCTVQGKEVSGEILIDLLPPSVEAILNHRNQQAAQIADLAARVENRDREVQREDAITPRAEGPDADYVNALIAQRAAVNLAITNVAEAKTNLAKLQAAYADELARTRAATTVKMRKTALVYEGLPVWECLDPRKRPQ